MVCPACGFQMSASDNECPRCHGKGLASTEATAAPHSQPTTGAIPGSGMAPGTGVDSDDKPSFVMALVGFLIPLAGLIIYLVQRDKQPLTARSAGRGAALGFGIQVVVVPVILLAAILFPVFARARENARRAACQQNIKQLYMAAMMYTQDNSEALPDLSSPASIRAALEKYAGGRDIFNCPLGHAYQGNPGLSGTKRGEIVSPSTTVLFSEPVGVHLGGHNEGFTDGSVRWSRDP